MSGKRKKIGLPDPFPGESFSALDIHAFTYGRVNPNLLRVWMVKYLKLDLPKQQGRERRFTFHELMEIVLTSEFSLHGVTVEHAAKWAHDVMDHVTDLKTGNTIKLPMFFVWAPAAKEPTVLTPGAKEEYIGTLDKSPMWLPKLMETTPNLSVLNFGGLWARTEEMARRHLTARGQ